MNPPRPKGAVVFIFTVVAALGIATSARAAVNVTQFHNHANRDGLYVDPAFTRAAAAGLTRDLTFRGLVSGDVYAQPLYIEGGPGGKAMIIAATEIAVIHAFDVASGNVIWERAVGPPPSRSSAPCAAYNYVGIIGTPVVDLASRTVFFGAMTTPDGGTTKKHLLFALNVDTGTTNSGWPVDLNTTASSGSTPFISGVQNQRGALALVNGYVYAPYGGLGDCGTYHGWIVGIPINNPASVLAWATTARGGGSWAVGGLASDGTDLFMSTGNTFGTALWAGGESIIRFSTGPTFSGHTEDYFTPTNWPALDTADLDLGSSGALVVDVPGAQPSKLVMAFGKDGNAYLLDRTNLGGISAPLGQVHASSGSIIQAAATYQTTQGVYVVISVNAGQLSAYRISPTTPPTMTLAWNVNQFGRGSPFVTSTDGTNDVVVWGIGSGGDQRLRGFDGDSGALIFTGPAMPGTRNYQTGIAARGRIYIANNTQVFAFSVPIQPIVLSNPTLMPDGSFRFGFTNNPGMSFTPLRTTNLALPLKSWTSLGGVAENSPGQFEFTDAPSDTDGARFYRVRSP